jgi:epoxide hydrolase-like predicted phosphatase
VAIFNKVDPKMERKIKAILFDFGGVFTDSPFDAFTTYGEKHGLSSEQVTDIVFGGYSNDNDHPWHQVERGEISLEQARDDILALGQKENMHIDIWEVFMAMAENGGGLRQDLVDYLPKIRAAGYVTGIITNNVIEFREHWRGMFAVNELFDFVIDSSEVGLRKPNPAIFIKALAAGDLSADEVLFLDDYAGNISAAKALNIDCILVDGDGAKTVKDLDALLGLL